MTQEHSLSAQEVQQLVAKAFVLEALTDKPGCTTRYEDLPGKPLRDFVLAGINCSGAFAVFAQSLAQNPNAPLFAYNVAALESSNKHKSAKYVNFGLLEIMFPVVAARLTTNDPDAVIDTVIELIKKTRNDDVGFLMATRKLAWSTSTRPYKTVFGPGKYKDLESVWDYYIAAGKDFPPESSIFQWTDHYKRGLPILRAFFDEYSEKGEVILSTKAIFNAQKQNNPQVGIGTLADMCAAAIFLWLSFNDRPA